MAANFDSVREFSLLTRALHELAKVCWGDFVLVLSSCNCDRCDDSVPDEIVICVCDRRFISEEREKIIAHRKTVINRISEILSSSLPKTLLNQLVDAVIRIQRGYHEALICTEIHRYRNKLETPHPLTTGPYSAKNFIDRTGRFDALAWVKRFVSDENRSALTRFEFACVYCFEETIKDLWRSTISKGRHPYEGGYQNILKKSNCFVAVWVCRMENKFDQVQKEESKFADGFFVGGFRQAMEHSNEYASRFFWAGCSDTEKANLMDDIIEDVDLSGLSVKAYRGYAGYVNFIYSLLPLEKKEREIKLDYNHDSSDICICILLSPFYEPMLNLILTIPFPDMKKTYAEILEALTSSIVKLPLADYKEIFEALWKPLSTEQRIEVLEMEAELIRNLTALKDMDLLETVIRPFSPALKERMLLYDWRYAGMSVLNEFSKEGDYDTMRRYLLLFLTDRDPETKRLSVRDGATDLLDRLATCEIFSLWKKGQIPETEKRGFKKVIDSLYGCLRFLHCILRDNP